MPSKEIQQYVDNAMKEIIPELDHEYCKANNIQLNIGTDEDMIDIDTPIVFSKQNCDTAYKILHPKSA